MAVGGGEREDGDVEGGAGFRDDGGVRSMGEERLRVEVEVETGAEPADGFRVCSCFGSCPRGGGRVGVVVENGEGDGVVGGLETGTVEVVGVFEREEGGCQGAKGGEVSG